MVATTPIDQAFITALRTFAGWEKLTRRELEVLERVIVHAESRLESAAALCISEKTFDAHWSHINGKLVYSAHSKLEHDLLIAYGRAIERIATQRAA